MRVDGAMDAGGWKGMTKKKTSTAAQRDLIDRWTCGLRDPTPFDGPAAFE